MAQADSNAITRRNFLATGAAVPALPALLVTTAEAGGPDAALLALIAECERLCKLTDELYDQRENMVDYVIEHGPRRPACMKVRGRSEALVGPIIEIERIEPGYYYDDGAIKKMRNWRYPNSPSFQARIDEIVAGYDQWRGDRARFEVEIGLVDLQKRHEQAISDFREVCGSIMSSRAKTFDGLLAKARLVRLVSCDQLDSMISGWPDEVDFEIAHSIALSIARDLLVLAQAA